MRGSCAVVLVAALVATAMPFGARAAPEPAGRPSGSRTAKPVQGVIVVAASTECRDAAKVLARQLYADHRLRPTIDEATARALVGDEQPPAARPPASAPAEAEQPGEDGTGGAQAQAAPDASAQPTDPLAETHEVVASIAAACSPSCEGSSVARRLIASLGRELGARLVAVVSCAPPAGEPAARPPRAMARVLHVAEDRFVPLVLTAEATADGSSSYRWQDATTVLASLLAAPVEPPKPRKAARRQAGGGPRPARAARVTAAGDEGVDEEDDDLAFLSSPWFWGGLGAVVAVGVTVFAVSQTSVNDPDVIRLEGRVSP